MSRQSSTRNELLYLTIVTQYSDDSGYSRSRYLEWRIFGWEGSIDIGSRWRNWRYFRYRFTVDHLPFDPEDSEGIYYHFKK